MTHAKLTKNANDALDRAEVHAKQLGHYFVGADVLARTLIDDEDVKAAIEGAGASFQLIEIGLTKIVDSMPESTNIVGRPALSAVVKNIVMNATMHSSLNPRQALATSVDMLYLVIRASNTASSSFLVQNGVTLDSLRPKCSVMGDIESMHSEPKSGPTMVSGGFDPFSGLGNSSQSATRRAIDDPLAGCPSLRRHGINLNALALDGKLDALVGRADEMDEIIMTLSRRRKNNPILVSDAGTGKTAIVEGLAQLLTSVNCPPKLAGHTIVSVSISGLVAGTSTVGVFEDKVKDIVEEAKRSGKIILFFDEIHTMKGAGTHSKSSTDMADMIKPALARGEIKVIGATTYAEYKSTFEKDKAIARRFQLITINPPGESDSVKILASNALDLEKFHGVSFEDGAIEAAVSLAKRYILFKNLPDSALDALDEAATRAATKDGIVTKSIIEDVISKMGNVPVDSVRSSELDKLASLEASIKKRVFEQDHAVETVSRAIIANRAGLTRDNKPILSALFGGPTGVGKTELAKQIAEHMGIKLIRFDMSEYSGEHSASKLVGSPAGYVGYEDGGLLTSAVIKNPHSVILLDEIEKASDSVFNTLLQVLDDGTLTDNQGNKADFRSVILIMTTNAGAKHDEKVRSIGFGSQKRGTGKAEERAHLVDTFSPEFLNRIDSIVKFNKLTDTSIRKVAEKMLGDLVKKAAERGFKVTHGDDVTDLIAKDGHDIEMGARPIARSIQTLILPALSQAMIFNADAKEINLVVVDGKIVVE